MRAVYKIITAVVILAVFVFLTVRLGYEGDTMALIGYVHGALGCVNDHIYTGCGMRAGPFVIFQYIPSWIVILLGFSDVVILHVLSYLSLVTFGLSFWEMFRNLKRKSVVLAWVGILVLGSGFNLRYANLSFGEMAASYLLLCFVIRIVSGGSVLSASLFGFASTLTKDTALPFLLLWLAASGRSKKDQFRIGLAMILGTLICFGFNYFRWGSILNLGYIGPNMVVHDLHTQISQFFAIWFSPMGGVVLFWTTFTVLLGVGIYLSFKARPGEHKTALRQRLPGWVVILTFSGLTLGFSKWYAPFGGTAWGERLMLPFIPAMSFWILWFYGDELIHLLRRFSRSKLRIGLASGVLAIAAFPQYAILLRHSLIGKVVDPASCIGAASVAECKYWPPWPWGLMEFYKPFPRPELFILAAFMSSWVVAICLKIRSELRSAD